MRDILRRLESAGLVKLPPPRNSRQWNRKQNSKRAGKFNLIKCNGRVDETPVSEIDWRELAIVRAKGSPNVSLWDYLVDSHHYLGKTTIVGRNLRQLVFANNRPIACVGWSDPSLKLAPRDEYLKSRFTNGWASVIHGTNNIRFLILPWVKVPNLASKTLSLAKRDVQRYWKEYYSVDLAWAETFVDPARYAGTCYLAANWQKVGKTRGTSRSGFSARRERHGIIKDILVYVFKNQRVTL